ncbi:dihydrolipoamide acetyltransferase component of pyruvate dehydrogenase complex [Actinomycetes bacterium]|nr:dihydrolipoamide acetyltransferase component of pyruvate dehydrogenase complex [Actinomycetes bacterium]
MSTNVTMPQLGESVTEGTVTRWLKNVGDVIKVDEAIVEVSTDKVDTEIPSPVAGVLLEIKAAQDSVVAVGGVMAVIGEAGSVTPSAPAPVAPVVKTPPPAPKPEPVIEKPVVQTPAPAPVAKPVVAPAASGSSVNVVLPALGESVTEGTVTRWLKNVGDSVSLDEAIVEISTDKVDTELPSPAAGVITEIKVAQDQVAAVGAVLAVISSSAGAVAPKPATPAPAPVVQTPPPAPKVETVVVPQVAPVVTPTPTVFATTSSSTKDTYATPIVRQLAKEKGIDISTISGSGVNGRVKKEDVLNATGTPVAAPSVAKPVAAAVSAPVATPTPVSAPAKPAAPAASVEQPLRGRIEQTTRLRRVIAERMVQSLHISAQLTSVVEVDVTKISSLRNKVKDSFVAREGVKLSFLPFFAKVAVETLKEFPIVNATISADATQIAYSDAIHLAVAVDTPRGLLVPVIRDAGDLSIAGLSRKIQDVANRTRDNKVTPDELSGGTFTLTNTGSRGALFDTPIINQPQVAILGTGAVVKRPVVVSGSDGNDQIAIRQMVYLALTYDHRLVDGADAARFLSSMKVRLEEANFESELGL